MSKTMRIVDEALLRKMNIASEQLTDFCQRWNIERLFLFGSALRDDFTPESDIDGLVHFAPEAEWSLLDHVRMERELAELAGRDVDLLTRQGIEESRHSIRKKSILESAQPV